MIVTIPRARWGVVLTCKRTQRTSEDKAYDGKEIGPAPPFPREGVIIAMLIFDIRTLFYAVSFEMILFLGVASLIIKENPNQEL